MIKRMADFFRKPVVYKTLVFAVVGTFLFFELIGPLLGFWKWREPTMLQGWIMRGR